MPIIIWKGTFYVGFKEEPLCGFQRGGMVFDQSLWHAIIVYQCQCACKLALVCQCPSLALNIKTHGIFWHGDLYTCFRFIYFIHWGGGGGEVV